MKGSATASGYLCVSLRKTNSGNFSDQDILDYTAALQLLITSSGSGGAVTELQDDVQDLEGRITALEDVVAGEDG